MTNKTGRGINIQGNAEGLFQTGDNSTQTATHISVTGGSEAVTVFVELMRDLIPQLRLSAEQEADASAALDDMRDEAAAEPSSPTGVQNAMRALVSCLSQAGTPVLTAVFMTLARRLGAV